MAAKKGQNFPPLYEHSFAEADACGEAEQYNASHDLNVECAKAISKALGEHYNAHTYCLDTKTASKEVVDKFGFERTMYVLASTVRHYDHDGRISHGNKKWARTFPKFDDKRMSSHYLVTGHPGLTDMFVNQVRHDHLLTQPMKAADVKAEAERIMAQFQKLQEPNGPDEDHFEVRVSPIFLERAKPRHMERLKSLLRTSATAPRQSMKCFWKTVNPPSRQSWRQSLSPANIPPNRRTRRRDNEGWMR